MLGLLVQSTLDDLLNLGTDLIPVGTIIGGVIFTMKLITGVYREMAQQATKDKDVAVAALAGLVKSVDAYADEGKANWENSERRLDSIDRAVSDIRDSLRRGS